MSRHLALLALTLLLAGCSRHSTRAQGPFNRSRPAPSQELLQGSAPAGKSALAINSPTTPAPPAPPGEASPVPQRPPEPASVGPTYTLPQQPRSPAAPANDRVVPAGGAVPAGPNSGVVPAAGAQPNPAQPPSTSGPTADNSNLAALKKLLQTASDKWKAVDTYEARMTRREVVNGTAGQTEEVLLQFRKEPMSVYMRNVGDAGKGREVLYNPSKFGDKMHIVTGAGDGFAGLKVTRTPDDPSVRARSRHTIREAGFGTTIGSFAALVAGMESGKLPADATKYVGIVKRPEYGELPLALVEQAVRPGAESLAGGGVRQWFFDAKPDSPSYGLPVLVILYEHPKAREIEYYCVKQFRGPAGLTDANFSPARLGKK